MDSQLEKLEKKLVTTRINLAKVLVEDLDIDKDVADMVAFDATNQALGDEALAKLEAKKALIAREQKERQEILERTQRRNRLKYKTVEFFKGLGIVLGVLIVLGGIGFGIYSIPSPHSYPRTYQALPERARFAVGDELEDYDELNLGSSNNLCVEGRSEPDERLGRKACVHPNKLNEINNALETAVQNNNEGTIYSSSNGNGEIWTIDRNNYRFIITADKDPNFKE